MKKYSLFSSILALLAFPAMVVAQNTTYVDNWIDTFSGWLSRGVLIIMVAMTLVFLWQVFRYVSEKDPKNLADRRKSMLNAMIGLFVAVSVWGIIKIAGGIFGTENNRALNPTCPPGTVYNSLLRRCE